MQFGVQILEFDRSLCRESPTMALPMSSCSCFFTQRHPSTPILNKYAHRHKIAQIYTRATPILICHSGSYFLAIMGLFQVHVAITCNACIHHCHQPPHTIPYYDFRSFSRCWCRFSSTDLCVVQICLHVICLHARRNVGTNIRRHTRCNHTHGLHLFHANLRPLDFSDHSLRPTAHLGNDTK